MEEQFSEEMDNALEVFVDTYGADAQLEQVIEECSELILAIQKYKRNIGKCQTIEQQDGLRKNVIDEVADVTIMMRQCNFIFSPEEITTAISYKVHRQKQRLESKKIK